MNKYKVICVVLLVALLATMARMLVLRQAVTEDGQAETESALVLRNILSRKSVREYTDSAVSREKLDTLVRAAMAAPTGRDMRPWKFIVVDDKDAMRSLAEKLPYAKMLASAQAAVVVCGDLSVTDKEGKPSTNWMFDCSAATENLLLQAEAMGLGAVWTAAYPYPERLEAVKAAFNLPEHIVPLNVIPIGYPKGDPQPKDKYNKDNIHYNAW